MIRSLRRRFILFSVLVISVIILIIGLSIFAGSHNELPWQRYFFSFLAAIALVFVGSWLLSKAAIRPIERAWQKQLDFTADASHELRTPIAAVRTNLELVMDSPDQTVKSQMKWLKNIEAENLRMARLVDDLLTLSRIDANQQMLEKESFILTDAVAEALAPLEAIARQKGIALVADIDQKAVYWGDRQRIKQLIVILADNALHYTDTGKVAISANQTGNLTTLTVTDTGRGMEAEHLCKIFDRFYRVTDTRALHADGAGLGLPIAKWIAEEHGGYIKVDSRPGEGTVFEVSLP